MLLAREVRDRSTASVPRLPAEDALSASLDDAARWIEVYDRMRAVIEQVLARTAAPEERAFLEAELETIRVRLGEWRARYMRMTGFQVDRVRRLLSRAGRSLRVTRRELELLEFLLRHPGRAFTSRQLAVEAWRNPWLSDSQVRTYVMRVRMRVAELGASELIDVVRDRGYRVVGAAGR